MKYLILVLTLSFSQAYASEVPAETQKIIFEEIGQLIYFEDEGYERLPTNISDFTYTVEDEFVIRVKGKSYSEWDIKELDYDCKVDVHTKGVIKSAKDITVSCDVQNENWPYWN